jgi:hypothetical protein
MQSRPTLLHCLPLGDLVDLAEQVIGQGHARQRRPRFELPVQLLRHVADLDCDHAPNMIDVHLM